MFQNNGFPNVPRTAGGYSLESYEPAIIHPEEQKRAEEMVKMAFTEKKPQTTVRRIVPRMHQINMKSNNIINRININPLQNQVIYIEIMIIIIKIKIKILLCREILLLI